MIRNKSENLAQILGVIFGLLQIYPTYKNLALEIPRVEKSEGEEENLPHLQESFFYSKVNTKVSVRNTLVNKLGRQHGTEKRRKDYESCKRT